MNYKTLRNNFRRISFVLGLLFAIMIMIIISIRLQNNSFTFIERFEEISYYRSHKSDYFYLNIYQFILSMLIVVLEFGLIMILCFFGLILSFTKLAESNFQRKIFAIYGIIDLLPLVTLPLSLVVCKYSNILNDPGISLFYYTTLVIAILLPIQKIIFSKLINKIEYYSWKV